MVPLKYSTCFTLVSKTTIFKSNKGPKVPRFIKTLPVQIYVTKKEDIKHK